MSMCVVLYNQVKDHCLHYFGILFGVVGRNQENLLLPSSCGNCPQVLFCVSHIFPLVDNYRETDGVWVYGFAWSGLFRNGGIRWFFRMLSETLRRLWTRSKPNYRVEVCRQTHVRVSSFKDWMCDPNEFLVGCWFLFFFLLCIIFLGTSCTYCIYDNNIPLFLINKKKNWISL